MPPKVLISNQEIKQRFKKLIMEYIDYVDSWQDEKITIETLRLYHRKLPASESMDNIIDEEIKRLKQRKKSTSYTEATDYSKIKGSRASLKRTQNTRVRNLLNRKTREPSRLLFYVGAKYEATINTKQYSQSQLLIMVELPNEDDLKNKKSISLMAAPPRGELPECITSPNWNHTETSLKELGWTKVLIPVTFEREHSQGNISAYRKQYCMRHIGASTVSFSIVRTLVR